MASNQIVFIVYLALAVSLGAGQALTAGEAPQCLAEIDKVGSELWIGMKIYDRTFGRGCGTCHDVAPNPNLFESVKTITFEEFDMVLREGKNAMPKAVDAILAVGVVQTAGYDDTQAIKAVFNYLQCQAGVFTPVPIDPDPAPVEPVPAPKSNSEFLQEGINHAEAGLASANNGDAEGVVKHLQASLNSLGEINGKFTFIEECTLDADGNTNIDALTDGLLLIRHMFGIRGESLVKDAIGIGCAQCSAADIEAFLDQYTATNEWDIDGNGEIDALTDGLLTIRYIFGIRQEALISNSVANGCTRCTVAEVEVYLQGLMR